jgi:hypothetical protein
MQPQSYHHLRDEQIGLPMKDPSFTFLIAGMVIFVAVSFSILSFVFRLYNRKQMVHY